MLISHGRMNLCQEGVGGKCARQTREKAGAMATNRILAAFAGCRTLEVESSG
jgi:hypothetical protein